MRKIYIPLLSLLLFSVQFSYAQQKTGGIPKKFPALATGRKLNVSGISPVQTNYPVMPNGWNKDRCGFITQMDRMKANGYDQNAFEAIIEQKVAEIRENRLTGRPTAVNYIIPVVFHIIHDGTAEGTGANIIASQVYQQIDQLNKDFGNQSGSPFGVASNTGISFCPVLQDPSGVTLAQPGIDRINRISKGWTDPTTFATPTAVINYVDATVKPGSIWDPTRFVNIWVYDFSASGLLGYATFPTAGLPDLPAGETATTAGVVFLTGSIGSVASPGTATPYALGRTVTHELGHFFGLYHTWGDVIDCSGTDYCGDTPPCSDEYYSQVPGCIIPTQCSGLPRMIQNYMDYSDDGCMNTYTQNQTDRIQAVMLAAPRRPRNPVATLCTPPVTNAVSFTLASTATAETGLGATCPKFKDYVVSVQPTVAASGNATVNFVFSGTATQNVDYSVVGGSSVSYVNGESAAKSITIRVNDDAAVESTETIIINFTIAGTGLVAHSINQTYTITITDDDVTNYINNTTQLTTLLSENFGTTASSGALPVGWLKGSFLTPAGANVWTVNPVYGASTGFTAGTNARVLHITNGNATAQTNETANAAYTASSESDAVVVTNAINTTGYQNIKVTFDYACNGEADLAGVYDFGALLYTTTAQTSGFSYVPNGTGGIVFFQGVTGKTSVTVTLPVAASNVANLWIGFEWYNDPTIGNNPAFIIDNIVVTGENRGVETVLNQTVTQTHNQGQTEQYMSSTGKIIAAITNLDANIGCITSAIKYAGTGRTSYSFASPSAPNPNTEFRTDKVISITPPSANTTASYQVTLYYTTAELAAWGAAVPNLKIMKVKDAVDIFGQQINISNTQFLPTTVDDQRATKGYASFTGTVTGSGFSQFMLSPFVVIPVTLSNFEAKANGKNILLNWTTVTEANNKGFVVERSIDGVNFERIGWVNGKMNSSQVTNYIYADNFVQPNIVYHYRLRQTDIDSREKLSEIRQAKIKASNIEVTISPNPAKDVLKVFVSGSTGASDVNLINAEGQIVRSWKKLNVTAAPASLDIRNLAAGMYMLQVVMPESTTVEKLVIK